MSNNGNQTAIVPVLKDVIKDQTSSSSVITSPEKPHETILGNYNPGGPASEPEVVIVGQGVAEPGFVFSQQPDAFNPQWVGRSSSVNHASPAPQAPRRTSCTSTYLQGVAGENIQNLLVWASPLTDTSGRWLENSKINSSTGTREYVDTLLYYLIQREDMNTGEVSTVGMVAHSRQLIAPLRTFLLAEHTASRPGAYTEVYTNKAVFDSGLYQNVLDVNGQPLLDEHGQPLTELCMPAGHEEYFQFLDTSAIYGHTYKYVITAVTMDQKEGESRTVVPGNPQAAGGTEVAFAPAWCSTFPVVDAGSTGNKSYLDLTLQLGALITDVDVSVIPIQDNMMIIDTTAPGASEPAVIETNPLEVLLYVGASTTTQVIEFTGRNIETCGGISTLSLGTGITLKANGITKTQVGTTADWLYKVQVDVQATTTLGIKTMVITCVNGKTALCSQFKAILGTGPGSEGPTFETPGDTYYFEQGDDITFIIKGKLMSSITGFTPFPNRTTVSIVSQSANHVEVHCTAFIGNVLLTPTLSGGKVRTLKDTVRVHCTKDMGGDDKDPTDYRSSGTARYTPTLRAT